MIGDGGAAAADRGRTGLVVRQRVIVEGQVGFDAVPGFRDRVVFFTAVRVNGDWQIAGRLNFADQPGDVLGLGAVDADHLQVRMTFCKGSRRVADRVALADVRVVLTRKADPIIQAHVFGDFRLDQRLGQRRHRFKQDQIRVFRGEQLDAAAVEIPQLVFREAVMPLVLAAVGEVGAVRADRREAQRVGPAGRFAFRLPPGVPDVLEDAHRLGDQPFGLRFGVAGGRQPRNRRLVARGDAAVRAGFKIIFVYLRDQLRLLRQDARGPEGVGQVGAEVFKGRAHRPVDDHPFFLFQNVFKFCVHGFSFITLRQLFGFGLGVDRPVNDRFGIFAPFLRRDEPEPEILEQPDDFLVLGINEDHRDDDVHRRENVGHGPEGIGLDVVQHDAGDHVIDHVDPHRAAVGLGVAKGVVDRLFTAVIHADDRRPREDRDRDGHEPAPGPAVGGLEGDGGQARAADPREIDVGVGQDDRQRRHATDDDGVEEDFPEAPAGLAHRVIGLGRGVGDDPVARPGVVGVQPPGDAVTERIADGRAGETADPGHRRKGGFHDQREGRRQRSDVGDQNAEAAEDVDQRHKGHDLFHDARNALQAAENRHEGGDPEDDDGDERRGAEALLQRADHRFGLDAARPRPEHEAAHGEDHRALLPAQGVLHHKGPVAHVLIHRFAVFHAVALAEDDFAGLGRHAEQAGDPHPEHGPGPAGDDRRRDATDVADADGVGHRRAGRGEPRNRAGAVSLLKHSAEGILQIKTDFPEVVPEAEADRQVNPGAEQYDDHRRPPKEVRDLCQHI